jgi:hypothetical protein
MTMRTLYVFCLIIGVAFTVAAQTRARNVTNADLERYRSARVNAERDLRENYARLGFASPEEMERRREKNRQETLELAQRLRSERLEEERLNAHQNTVTRVAYVPAQVSVGGGFYGTPFLTTTWGMPWWDARHHRRHGRLFRVPFQQSGYFAGGQFWPTGGATVPRPLINIRNR